MLNKRNLALAIIAGLTSLSGCRKMDMPKETPKCVLDHLDEFKRHCCPGSAEVRVYEFQGRTVFVFDEGYCIADGASEVMDEQCAILGYLGGLMGNSTINGENFNQARFEGTLWEN